MHDAGLFMRISFLLCTTLIGCSLSSPESSAQTVSLEKDVIAIRGPINEQTVVSFNDVLGSSSGEKVKAVIVSSAGGDGRAALQIAKSVASRGLNVIVEGVCISACAQYIFLAGVQKIVRPGSIIAFHSSPQLLRSALLSQGLKSASDVFARHVDEYRAFLQEKGIDQSIDLRFAVLKNPLCLAESADKGFKIDSRYGIAWQYSGFVPSKNQLEVLGVKNISGVWPSNEGIDADLERLGFNNAFKVRHEPNLDVRLLPTTFVDNLPLCASR